MQYPKQVMKISELKKMGFPEEWLMQAFRMQGRRPIAWRMGMTDRSAIVFDTEELEKYRKSQCVGR